jgi:hypothetical protein
MTMRRAVLIAAFALLVPPLAVPARAQIVKIPAQAPPCVKEFLRLRNETTRRGMAIKAAEHKVTPQQACRLFDAYSAAEAKMLKYATDNSVWCGIPGNVAVNIKKAHAQTIKIRARVCRAAAAGPRRPPGPSLSDALGGAVPDSNNTKSGQGVFDTLTGSPLGK